MTFDPDRPVKFTGDPPERRIVSPSAQAVSARRASGITRLKADLRRAPNVKFVLFFVDDQMVAIVNHPPFEYPWNTKDYANGLHTVRIQGRSADSQVVSEKSIKVWVENEDAKPRMLTGVRVDELRTRLLERMKLTPSAAAIHYMLAKCARAAGDTLAAAAHLEKVMAADPNYLDARALLKQTYGRIEPYRELRSGPPNGGREIALTFDDGPNPKTERILDILAETGTRATFFVVGEKCEEFPEVVARMHREGHDVQNHTYSHRNLEALPQAEIEKELFKTIAVIRDLTGRRSIFYRAPGGHLNGNGKKVASAYGLLPVYWTVNCGSVEGTTPEKMVNRVCSAAAPGGIVLLHNAEDVTIAALPAIISGLKGKGFKFVTVSDMFFGR